MVATEAEVVGGDAVDVLSLCLHEGPEEVRPMHG